MYKNPLQTVTKRADGTLSVQTVNKEPTMTKQQFKDECDINNIIKHYTKTGQVNHLSHKQGRFADLSILTDYHDMVNSVAQAKNAFMALPATVRSRFKNDPGQLLSFLQDPKNYDEALSLNLINPRAEKNDDKTKQTTTNTAPTQSKKTKTTTVVEDL